MTVVEELRKTSFVTADAVKKQFFKKPDDEDDLISAGALVSLKCPLGLSRIKTPVRSKFCDHSQCFDGETFLQLNMQRPTWKCPICSIKVKSWRELIVDGYFESILKGTSENDDQVHVDPDGSWKPKGAKDSAVNVDRSAGNGRAADFEDLDAIDLSDAGNPGSRRTNRNKRRRTEVVDLTLDSESDGNDTDSLPSISQEDIQFIDTTTSEVLEMRNIVTPSGSAGSSRSNSNSENIATGSGAFGSGAARSVTDGSASTKTASNIVLGQDGAFNSDALVRVLQTAIATCVIVATKSFFSQKT
ncbi:E3 SUMO-protein ligase pli1 [Dipsacomyces acuminosporus]|nr:E3 SUMO-protein ligase pli1 [Dipsacomyces acuminosporus]